MYMWNKLVILNICLKFSKHMTLEVMSYFRFEAYSGPGMNGLVACHCHLMIGHEKQAPRSPSHLTLYP